MENNICGKTMRLKDLKPSKEFLLAVDSDGCVFDAMGIKQRECFCPWMISCFRLQPVAQAARECKEFADLTSKTRGANRHKTMVKILIELLPSHPKVKEIGFQVPKFEYYYKWVNKPDSMLNDDGLKRAIANSYNHQEKVELEIVLDWSKKVNQAVAAIVKNIPPFNYVRESFERAYMISDIMVCSATPTEALEREWAEHNIDKYMKVIAGQESGSKAEQLEMISNGKYGKNKILMIGDALGDLAAAKENGTLFYPIIPGDEVASWKLFHDEVFNKFINCQYDVLYEAKLIDKFERCLPENPPW